MKGVMKGKLMKKLKSIRPIGYLKPDRILQVYAASDGNFGSHLENPSVKVETGLIREEVEPKKVANSGMRVEEPEVIDVAELMRDLEDEDEDFDEDIENKENICPPKSVNSLPSGPEVTQKRASEESDLGLVNYQQTPLAQIDISSFRRPELNSCSLFDPNLLAAFEQVVKVHMRIREAETRARTEQKNPEENEEEEQEPPSKARRLEELSDDDPSDDDPLLGFEEKCIPGGTDSVVLYTTSLRGIRKTFEDCNSIRFLLDSFRVLYFERDLSMHMEFKEEMWKVLDGKPLPPRLFIKGRYIGGAEEVLVLHEQGKLRPLLEGIPLDQYNCPCEACAGIRFVLCFSCNGSHKVVNDDGKSSQCKVCNENGLVICPYCC